MYCDACKVTARKEVKLTCTRNWRLAHKNEISEYNKKWAQEHKEERSEYRKGYYQKNRDSLLLKGRLNTHMYHKAHPEEHRAYTREWKKANPELVKQNIHKRRARKKGNGGSYTTIELHELWHKQNGFCFYCGELLYKTLNSVYHIEHKIPLSRGGSNSISNIVLSCEECNLRKGTKTSEEFTLSISEEMQIGN